MDSRAKKANVLQELRDLEPIFHTSCFGTSLADYARRMDEHYCEVGASGTRYTRDFLLQHVASHPPVDAADAGWTTSGHAAQEVARDTWLFTYTLHQGQRITRRSTLWQDRPSGWTILYHQGTIVAEGKVRG